MTRSLVGSSCRHHSRAQPLASLLQNIPVKAKRARAMCMIDRTSRRCSAAPAIPQPNGRNICIYIHISTIPGFDETRSAGQEGQTGENNVWQCRHGACSPFLFQRSQNLHHARNIPRVGLSDAIVAGFAADEDVHAVPTQHPAPTKEHTHTHRTGLIGWVSHTRLPQTSRDVSTTTRISSRGNAYHIIVLFTIYYNTSEYNGTRGFQPC